MAHKAKTPDNPHKLQQKSTKPPRGEMGRPTLYGETLARYSVRITAQHAAWLEELGGGNLSAGLRKLLEAAAPTGEK